MDSKNFVLVLLILLTGIIGQTLMKIGSVSLGAININGIQSMLNLLIGMIKSPLIVAGVFFYGVAAIIWVILLNRVELSIAVPFISLNYILTLIAGAVIFKEAISTYKVLGIFTIIAGVVLLTRR